MSAQRYAALPAALIAIGALVGAAGCADQAAQGRPWVHKLTFGGVRGVKKKDLVSKLAVEQTSWVPFAPKHYLDPFDLTLDRKRIESYYHAHGFFRMRLASVEVKPRNAKSVDVKIDVEEGPVTRVDDVTLTGLEGLGAEGSKIAAGQNLRHGDPFDSEKFTAWTDHILDELKARGYAWAKVDGGADVDRDRAIAHLRVTVEPGPQVYIGHITTEGDLGRLSTSQFLVHTGLKEGQLWTPELQEIARTKIYGLAIFSSVKIDATPIITAVEGPPDKAEIKILIHPGPLHELRLGGGAAIEFERQEVRLRAIYTQRNFLGGLRTLRLSLEPAYVAIPSIFDVQRHGPAGTAEVQFTQPDVLLPLSELKLTVGYDLGIDYAYQYHGPRTQLAYSRAFLRDRLQVSLSYNFQLLMFFNTDPTILSDPARAHRLFGYTDPYRLGWWQEDVALDLRDRPLSPSKGVYLALTAEEGGVYAGGAFSYEKLIPQLRGYVPIGRWHSDRVVLATRVLFGQIFVQGDLGSPITRRFYLGGPDSHRGFNYNRLSPQVPSGFTNVRALPIGGDQMLLLQLEARFNLFQIAGNWLEAALFGDAGDVSGAACPASAGMPASCSTGLGKVSDHVDITNLHYAVGGGLRFKTIIGTIRLDVGVRLNRLSDTEADGTQNPDPHSRVAVHISLGEPF